MFPAFRHWFSRTHFALRLLLLIGLWLVVCFGASAGLLKRQWDYVLQRPSPDSRTGEFREILSITPIKASSPPDGRAAFAIDQDELRTGLALRLATVDQHPYYCLAERVLVDLRRRGIELPEYTTTELPADLFSRLEKNGVLMEGSSGYSTAKDLCGLLVTARSAEGEYLFLGASGGEIGNDDYPFYEFLFEKRADGALHLMSWRRFIYGVAGIEGMEGLQMWLILSGLFLMITSPLLIVGVTKSVSTAPRE